MSILYPPLPDYPVKTSFSSIEPQLKKRELLALEAPTGSGKTTLLPLLIHTKGLSSKKILLTQPRRLAAKSVTQRMAQLTSTKAGDLVGYRLRGESRVSSETRIEVVTEGYALAMLQADPFMSGYDWVIIDEFHERHIEGDLLLAFLRDLRSSVGPDDSPGLVLMTATWQGQPREALTDFSFNSIEGRLFPVHRSFSKEPSQPEQNLQARLELAVIQAVSETSGKVLVFLPGRREIEDAYRHFSARNSDYELSRLYGGMELSEQQKVLNYDGPRRQIILSTAIAETSLTIEGVTAVVDSGLERLPLYQPNLGLTRLVTRRVSRATAVQRAGRAGRLGQGSCFSLWTEA
ncbi:MAG TPA: ATP-dependent helicase HrpB, partial [Spirochaeta sp.]|nr:ATP-dependent helicase HrpB [Spirochaeta sp.]